MLCCCCRVHKVFKANHYLFLRIVLRAIRFVLSFVPWDRKMILLLTRRVALRTIRLVPALRTLEYDEVPLPLTTSLPDGCLVPLPFGLRRMTASCRFRTHSEPMR